MTLSREKDVLASVCTVASAVERLEAACSRFKALGESSAVGAPADTADLQCSLARGRDQLSALESTLRALHSSRQVVAVAPTPAELQPPCVDVTYSDGGRRLSAAGGDASGRSGGATASEAALRLAIHRERAAAAVALARCTPGSSVPPAIGLCQSAISALQFRDHETAVSTLSAAIGLLCSGAPPPA
ncbi:hypothetical protein EMIHUDRAFT_229315 [Emiliania huxleyi CCMP1516]|uniref:Uncharacterized protein n=2 Tax=Emiliania huxleyi TaxID=2903 RepID=A0A0D3KDG2_EMIH1|nr:hypothetical protein EMIHUDRAFT_229315 [Emiliania huxleyi CCMP1516]EOD33797.1 hypothetical protein EMIHUDRAFT_229315 [Emiliania huxleyi CCMP1516]|eukprot:XP_005786226.1 hypothetical protein EMIHUDRAFT_229315 [Emiliania huxleyi CCMP1516]